MTQTETNTELIERISSTPFDATLDRLATAIKAAGMQIFARIDHAAGAREAGLSLPPTTVLIYGHAKGGTPIILEAPAAALDLPLRVLVREGADGRAIVAFHPVAPMLQRAGVPQALAQRLEPAQALLTEAIRS